MDMGDMKSINFKLYFEYVYNIMDLFALVKRGYIKFRSKYLTPLIICLTPLIT